MKKIVSVMIASVVLMFAVMLSANAASSGTCGTNLTWTLDDNGVLTINGTGKMTSHDWDNTLVKRVVIGDGVTEICYRAFYDCDNLESVIIGDGVTEIETDVFCSCNRLKNVKLGKSVKEIGTRAFAGCAIETIELPDSLERIGQSAFSNCDLLKEIEIPNRVATIVQYAFNDCDNLARVVIGDGVTEICYRAFYDCDNLESVIIGDGVTEIETDVFCSCNRLKNVYYCGTESQWNSIIIGKGNTNLTSANIHYNYIISDTPSQDTINTTKEVTVIGKGTAYGNFKITDTAGRDACNTLVNYTVDGGTINSKYTDEYGNLSVKVGNIRKSADYDIDIFGNGIQPINATLKVTVKPIEYTSKYSASMTGGGEWGLEIGAGGSVGKLKAEAKLAEIGVDLSENVGIELNHEYKNDKHKLEVDATINFDAVSEALVGAYAGIEEYKNFDWEAQLLAANGKVGFGNTAGISFKDDDFDINNKSDTWDLSKFLLSAYLQSLGSNVMARYVADMLDTPVSSYSKGSSVVLGYGAKAMVNEIGDDETALVAELAGGECESLFERNTRVNSDNSVEYSSRYLLESGYNLLSGNLCGGDTEVDAGKYGQIIGNDVTMTVKRNPSGNIDEFSFNVKDNEDNSIFVYKDSKSTNYNYSFEGDAAKAICGMNSGLAGFSKGDKGFFTKGQISEVEEAILYSDQDGEYSVTNEYEKGLDIDLAVKVKAIEGLGIKAGISGIEGYEFTKVRGVYENGKVYPESESDIAKEVKDSFIGIEDMISATEEQMGNFLESCWNTVKGKIGGEIKAGKAVLKSVGDTISGWTAKIVHPTETARMMVIPTADDEITLLSDVEIATTIGDPYIIEVFDEDDNAVSEFSSKPLLLEIEYSEEQLIKSGMNENDVKLYRWDEDKCVYIIEYGTIDTENNCVSKEIMRGGQYILAVDKCPPSVTEFKASDNGNSPVISAVIDDMSGIADFSFSIDGSEVISNSDFEKYYSVSVVVKHFCNTST